MFGFTVLECVKFEELCTTTQMVKINQRLGSNKALLLFSVWLFYESWNQTSNIFHRHRSVHIISIDIYLMIAMLVTIDVLKLNPHTPRVLRLLLILQQLGLKY